MGRQKARCADQSPIPRMSSYEWPSIRSLAWRLDATGVNPDHCGMARQLPRFFLLPLLVCLVATAAFVAVGGAVMANAASIIDPSRLQISLPGQPAPSNTVWLCKPGMANNPCMGDLSSTVVAANGSTRIEPASPAHDPPIDCFYIYPTVSVQKTVNANLKIDQEERNVARAEASRFSQVCNVYAPMYPQLTRAAIDKPEHISVTGFIDAYEGVWKAFLDYKDHYNHGRGIVFVGHSQGAFLLSMLIQAEVDTEPTMLSQLISAVLPGGNVTVEAGKSVGGDFRNIPACDATTQIGCVVAYSSFSSTPGEDALFGRVDSPINPFRPDSPTKLRVLCVNPAAPAGGSGVAIPYMPTGDLSSLLGSGSWPSVRAGTGFVTYPGEFRTRCETDGKSDWLQVDRVPTRGDSRPGFSKVENRQWGLHMVDVSIVLGNLVDLVRSQSAAYAREQP